MEPRKAARKLTDEIIKEFRLPRTVCYPFINTIIQRGIGVGFDLGRRSTVKSKPVASLDKNGRIVKTYISMAEAARGIGATQYSGISRAIRTGVKSGGYHWKLVDPNDHYVYRKIK